MLRSRPALALAFALPLLAATPAGCSLVDATVIRRALLVPPTATIVNQCVPPSL